MIEKPGIRLTAEPAGDWSATGPLAERALAFAAQFAQSCSEQLPPHRLVVEQCAPEHVGLGVGTQLGMAVAKALAVSMKRDYEAADLARLVGRGLRSGIGVHGFEQGGFLVDGGKGPTDDLAPLLCRVPFPEAWRVVLILRPGSDSVSGAREQEAFSRLVQTRPSVAITDALCRLVMLGMLPAIQETDFQAFGEALFDFNVRVGELFSTAQAGTYSSSFTAEAVQTLRGLGVRGVGQSSWGPTVFAVVENEETAGFVAREMWQRFVSRFALAESSIIVTRALNEPSAVEGG
jgi:beta-RFAP synthase